MNNNSNYYYYYSALCLRRPCNRTYHVSPRFLHLRACLVSDHPVFSLMPDRHPEESQVKAFHTKQPVSPSASNSDYLSSWLNVGCFLFSRCTFGHKLHFSKWYFKFTKARSPKCWSCVPYLSWYNTAPIARICQTPIEGKDSLAPFLPMDVGLCCCTMIKR